MRLSASETLLHELGVTEPSEIDLNAISYYVGAHVRYKPLDGCEARIIGHNDKAIITVNARSSHRRQRFSIAHELGHWRYHRGRCLACRVEEYRPRETQSPERTADAYAADLLMPSYLFLPLARQYAKPSFKAVDALAEKFDTSRSATAIRLVESDLFPALLIYHGLKGRKWFARAPNVPSRWFPRQDLDPSSSAFGILFGSEPNDPLPRKVGADAWFDRKDAERYEVYEQTIRMSPTETLSLVHIDEPRMLEN